jgi:hypothetical protein
VPSLLLQKPILLLSDPMLIITQYGLMALAAIIASSSSLIPDVKTSTDRSELSERTISEFWARIVIIAVFAHFCLLLKLDHEPISFLLKLIAGSPVRVMVKEDASSA